MKYDEIFAEFAGETWGPYYPIFGPVLLHRYRAFHQGKVAERADRIHTLAAQLGLAEGDIRVVRESTETLHELPHQPFIPPDSAYQYSTVIAAKLAIAGDLATLLARMSDG